LDTHQGIELSKSIDLTPQELDDYTTNNIGANIERQGADAETDVDLAETDQAKDGKTNVELANDVRAEIQKCTLLEHGGGRGSEAKAATRKGAKRMIDYMSIYLRVGQWQSAILRRRMGRPTMM
jgi:hypothetical protein